MGDLQCPARVFLVAAHEAAAHTEGLRSQRLAAVYAPPVAAQAAAAVAAALGLAATVVDVATSAGDPSAGAAPLREALADIADRYRGEAVLLVDESGSWAAALRGLVPGGVGPLPPGTDGLLALEADADGWRRVAASA